MSGSTLIVSDSSIMILSPAVNLFCLLESAVYTPPELTALLEPDVGTSSSSILGVADSILSISS